MIDQLTHNETLQCAKHLTTRQGYIFEASELKAFSTGRGKETYK